MGGVALGPLGLLTQNRKKKKKKKPETYCHHYKKQQTANMILWGS